MCEVVRLLEILLQLKDLVIMSKGLIFKCVFTDYLYYNICISNHVLVRLSKLLCITKWMSKLPHVGSAALLQTADTPCDLGTCLFSPLP